MNLEQLRKQAKELVRAARAGDREALERLGGRELILANAQLALARELGFPSWSALVFSFEKPTGSGMFGRFTEDARRVVVEGQSEARSLGHDWIGTEHLLLGSLRVDGIAAGALADGGLTFDRAQATLLDIGGRGEGAEAAIPFTPEAKQALEASLRWALAFGLDVIDPRLLLLGVLSVQDGGAARVLRDCAVDIGRVVASLGLKGVDPTAYRPDADAKLERRPEAFPTGAPRPSYGVVPVRPTSRTPREAIEALLAGGLAPFGLHSVSRASQPEPQPVEGAPFTVHPETVRFLKEREVLDRHIYAVTVQVTPSLPSARRHDLGRVLLALRAGSGWIAMPGCGIPDGRPPEHLDPFALLAGHWSAGWGFVGAARVFRREARVTSVRLRFTDGSAAEADADDDLALFWKPFEGPAPLRPSTLELLDGDRVIATQDASRHRPQR